MHGVMSTKPTPVLAPESVKEILAEMSRPPADTPERRATFARARYAEFLVRQVSAATMTRKDK